MPPDPLRHNAATRRVLELTEEVRTLEEQLGWADHWRKNEKIGPLKAQIAAKQAEMANPIHQHPRLFLR